MLTAIYWHCLSRYEIHCTVCRLAELCIGLAEHYRAFVSQTFFCEVDVYLLPAQFLVQGCRCWQPHCLSVVSGGTPQPLPLLLPLGMVAISSDDFGGGLMTRLMNSRWACMCVCGMCMCVCGMCMCVHVMCVFVCVCDRQYGEESL